MLRLSPWIDFFQKESDFLIIHYYSQLWLQLYSFINALDFFSFLGKNPECISHIEWDEGEAKFWIEPVVALADYSGISKKTLRELQTIAEERTLDITKAWKKHLHWPSLDIDLEIDSLKNLEKYPLVFI